MIVSTIINRFRTKEEKVVRPSDIIRLSIDDELSKIEAGNEEDDENLFEKLTAKYGKTLEKPADERN